jgi:hypothetical protein
MTIVIVLLDQLGQISAEFTGESILAALRKAAIRE